MKKVMFFVLMFCGMSLLFSGCESSDNEAETDDAVANFEKLRNVCNNTSNIDLEHDAAVEMSKVAESFDEWEWVRLCAIDESDLEITAVQHMANISNKSGDTNDMHIAAVYAYSTNQMELRVKIVKAMVAVANKDNKFDDWLNVSIVAKYTDIPTYFIALDKMAKTAITANDWTWVFRRVPSDSPFRIVALVELGRLTPSFYNWCNIAIKSRYNDSVTYNMALTKMSQTAKSSLNWELVYEWAPAESELQKLAFKKIVELSD